jgi:TRAP-type uncharacterized transport system fused permease subunit
MDFALLFAPVATGVIASVEAALPVAIPVLIALASISIVIGLFRKFGVRK